MSEFKFEELHKLLENSFFKKLFLILDQMKDDKMSLKIHKLNTKPINI